MSCKCYKWKKIFRGHCWKYVALALLFIGIGMIIAVLTPIWIWVLFMGVALVALGVKYFN